jgi:hypothetical protein
MSGYWGTDEETGRTTPIEGDERHCAFHGCKGKQVYRLSACRKEGGERCNAWICSENPQHFDRAESPE